MATPAQKEVHRRQEAWDVVVRCRETRERVAV